MFFSKIKLCLNIKYPNLLSYMEIKDVNLPCCYKLYDEDSKLSPYETFDLCKAEIL